MIVHLNRGNEEDSFVNLALVGMYLNNLSPEIAAVLDYKTHGYSTLAGFLQASGIVELKRNGVATLVRLKDNHSRSLTATTEPSTLRQTSPFQNNPTSPVLGSKPIDQAALEGIRKTITANLRGDDDEGSFVSLDMFANDYVHKQSPDLHYRNYGYS